MTDPQEAARVACPFCGTRVMRDATLCFSCWHNLESIPDDDRHQ